MTAPPLTKQCNDCQLVLPASRFFWVSRASGRLRGQCKSCMMERKREQRDPDWKPNCPRCNARLKVRAGSGTRLCETCFAETYDLDDPRERGSHRIRLKPCTLCGGKKERFERGKLCRACKPWAGYGKSLRRFGLTPVEYVAILNAQGGGCYICGSKPDGQRLSIDHDHAVPEGRAAVRGLLCNDCNYSRLPRFNEDVEMLRRAVAYLTAPPAGDVLRRPPALGEAPSPQAIHLAASLDDDAGDL